MQISLSNNIYKVISSNGGSLVITCNDLFECMFDLHILSSVVYRMLDFQEGNHRKVTFTPWVIPMHYQ